jgi:lipid-binding SYLF domain-containing protein
MTRDVIIRPVAFARLLGVTLGLMVLAAGCATSSDSSSLVIEADATAALRHLYAEKPLAADLGKRAKAILIFPGIVKGGLLAGGQHGYGVLRMNGKTIGYYNIVTASYGLQAGLQRYNYVMFLMTDAALAYLLNSDGWELGSGPSVVFVDAGLAWPHTTTKLRKDVYAFVFDQEGFMAGLGLQGSKITEITPNR